MKKVLVRVERALVKVAVAKPLRPLEREVVMAVARSVLVRASASAVVTAAVVELVNRYLA